MNRARCILLISLLAPVLAAQVQPKGFTVLNRSGWSLTVSSTDGSDTASKAVDGDANTNWMATSSPAWIQVDTGATQAAGPYTLTVGDTHGVASSYQVDVSPAGCGSYTTVASGTFGTSGSHLTNAHNVEFTATSSWQCLKLTWNTWGYLLYAAAGVNELYIASGYVWDITNSGSSVSGGYCPKSVIPVGNRPVGCPGWIPVDPLASIASSLYWDNGDTDPNWMIINLHARRTFSSIQYHGNPVDVTISASNDCSAWTVIGTGNSGTYCGAYTCTTTVPVTATSASCLKFQVDTKDITSVTNITVNNLDLAGGAANSRTHRIIY